MFSAAIIVFRESLEAFLIISIMVAATRGISHRGKWIAGGVLIGLLGSALVASGMERISSVADGMGQELFNVGILVIAVAMLAWLVVAWPMKAPAVHKPGVGSAAKTA